MTLHHKQTYDVMQVDARLRFVLECYVATILKSFIVCAGNATPMRRRQPGARRAG